MSPETELVEVRESVKALKSRLRHLYAQQTADDRWARPRDLLLAKTIEIVLEDLDASERKARDLWKAVRKNRNSARNY